MYAVLVVVGVLLFCPGSCELYKTNITVSESGSDNTTCLQGDRIDCKTLRYALQGLDNSTSIRVTYSHELAPTTAMYVSHKHDVAITGIGSVEINCKMGAGISFISSASIVINGISWIGCSVSHPTSGYFPERDIFFPNTSSALFFHQCMDVSISECRFTSTRGSGVSMYDVGGLVVIEHTEFNGNSHNCSSDIAEEECSQIARGLLIEFTYCGKFETCQQAIDPSPCNSNSTYKIHACNFIANENVYSGTAYPEGIPFGNYHWPFGKGGGLVLSFRGASNGNTVTITGGTSFLNNHAEIGGSVVVEILDQASNNSIAFDGGLGRLNFTRNMAVLGGALFVQIFLFKDNTAVTPGNNSLIVTDADIVENTAVVWGGALYFQTNGQASSREGLFLFVDCLWKDNVAFEGPALGISLEYDLIKNEVSPITFVSNTWINNGELCAINTNQIALSFSGTTLMEDSPEQGLCSSSTVIYMEGELTFRGNSGPYGAAIALWGLAWIKVMEGTNLTFENNYGSYGGAIYHNSLPFRDALEMHGTVRQCLFEYEDPSVPVEDWNANITFVGNYIGLNGRGAGESIYLSNPYNCIRNNTVLLLIEEVFKYYPNKTGHLATPAANLTLNPPIICSNDSCIMDIMLGQKITFNVIAQDYFNNTVETTVDVDLFCPYRVTTYGLSGSRALVVRNSHISSDLYIHGPDKRGLSHCYLLLLGADLSHVVKRVNLSFVQPRLGFVYDRNEEIYSCSNSEYITCNDTSLQVCVHYGYWYGEIESGDNPVYTTGECPTGFCRFANGRCPTSPCDKFNTFCELPKDEDDQCIGFRGGPLCAGCKPGYSFSYDAVKCVSNDTCSVAHFILFLFLNMVIWIVFIVLVLVILRLKLRVGTGHMYGFLYYFSIVLFLLPETPPSSFLTATLSIFTSITQLDPQILGLIEICVIKNLGGLGHTVLHYFHPFFISLVILFIIYLARCRPQFLRRLSDLSPIHAICVLILLSFASVTKTSFDLLSPVRFRGTDQLYVRVEPTVHYFDPQYHLPYALVALLVEITIIIPLIVILLTAPLLVRYVNLTKIKPILDEYQACFRDEYRWMAGFYFLARQGVYLVSAFHIKGSGNIYLLQLLCIVIALFHTALQPYKSRFLNIFDMVLLYDLMFISLLYGGTADAIFRTAEEVRSAFVHILTLIPILYLFGIFSLLVLKRVVPRIKKYFETREQLQIARRLEAITERSVQNSETSDTVPTVSYIPAIYDRDRESLLGLLDSEETYSAKYEATKRDSHET